jgi:hypothetical protein
MPLTTSNSQIGPAEAYQQIRGSAMGMRQQATVYNTTLSAGNVTSVFVYQVLDQTRSFISNMQAWAAISGLDAYATGQGYPGSMVADVNTAITAAQAMIAWVVNNFPSTGGYLQAETLNADGSRTLRQFTPVQTAGWQTTINNFINTIS